MLYSTVVFAPLSLCSTISKGPSSLEVLKFAAIQGIAVATDNAVARSADQTIFFLFILLPPKK